MVAYGPRASWPVGDSRRRPADDVDRLIKLGEMHDSGLLTDDEFQATKSRLLEDGG